MNIYHIASLSLIIILSACSPNDESQSEQTQNKKIQSAEAQNITDQDAAETSNPQDEFFNNLTARCGQSFTGKLVSDDELDTAMSGKDMRISITNCSETRIDIPFHIEREKDVWDRSRTWVITRTNNGLRLKHDHRHEDGSEDKITQYGGDTSDTGSAELQHFPVDDESKILFTENGLTTSSTNIWSVGITDDIYSYQMERVNRKFRVEFDLSKPVDTPPPAWGHE